MAAKRNTPAPARSQVQPAAPENSAPVYIGEDHPAYARIDLANQAAHQLMVLLNQLVQEIATGEEDAFVAMALASRARKLASAASRLLSEPACEIDMEECEAEVTHG